MSEPTPVSLVTVTSGPKTSRLAETTAALEAAREELARRGEIGGELTAQASTLSEAEKKLRGKIAGTLDSAELQSLTHELAVLRLQAQELASLREDSSRRVELMRATIREREEDLENVRTRIAAARERIARKARETEAARERAREASLVVEMAERDEADTRRRAGEELLRLAGAVE